MGRTTLQPLRLPDGTVQATPSPKRRKVEEPGGLTGQFWHAMTGLDAIDPVNVFRGSPTKEPTDE